jgi:hypothetical protein
MVRQRQLPPAPEAGFTRQVLALARLRGWRTARFRPAGTTRGWRTAVRGDGVGFPDLVLLKGGLLPVAELKVGNNRLNLQQREHRPLQSKGPGARPGRESLAGSRGTAEPKCGAQRIGASRPTLSELSR